MEAIRTVVSWLPGISVSISTRVIIDDFVFRLHYTLTSGLLMLVALFSGVLLLFDWIHCYSNSVKLQDKLLNVYCWMQNTYILPSTPLPGRYGVDQAHPGVDKATSDSDKVYINYYQWIPFLIMYMAISFKGAHFFWKKWEHDDMRNLTWGFQFPIAKKVTGEEFKQEEIDKHLDTMAKHIAAHWREQKSRPFSFCFLIFLNLMNVVLNIVILNDFFGTKMIRSGFASIPEWYVNYYNRNISLYTIFPRVVKCSYFDYGAGGSVQTIDIMCFLPFNVYNEKFFVIFSLWLIILLVLTALSLIYWLLLIMIPPLRKLGCKSCEITPHWIIEFLDEIKDYDRGDWYFMHMLQRNMHKNHYLELLIRLKPLLQDRRNLNSSMIEVVTRNENNESRSLLTPENSKNR